MMKNEIIELCHKVDEKNNECIIVKIKRLGAKNEKF